MLIFWDEPKRLANIVKHGFDFSDLDEAFFLAAVVIPVKDSCHMAVGHFYDGTIAVVFSHLESEGLSVISMRRANRSERKLLIGAASQKYRNSYPHKVSPMRTGMPLTALP